MTATTLKPNQQQHHSIPGIMRRELVIIDPRVDQWEILAAGVRPDCEVVILNPEEDGIHQITEILVGTRHCRVLFQPAYSKVRTQQCCVPTEESLNPEADGIQQITEILVGTRPLGFGDQTPTPYTLHPTPIHALHIISHGAPGTLFLGNSILNAETLQTRYHKALQQWPQALAENAHILIYGCNVAAPTPYTLHPTPQLLKQLHQLTGAQIYANPQPTGNPALGGTWNLQPIFPPTPYTLHPTPFSQHTLTTYPALLLEPEYVSSGVIGGSNSDEGYSITIDSSGNIYITGFFEGTADFDPSGNTFNLTSAGNRDIFITKLNADGSFAWAKNLGGSNTDEGYDIAVDNSGNVYTTGFFEGTADFDPDPGNTYNLTSSGGSYDIFISKLSADGSFAWAKDLGASNDDRGYGLSIDSSGNVYTTGKFRNTVDFDPDPGNTYNLTSSGGIDDIFISKLDADGNFVWAKKFGGSDWDFGRDIAIDSSDNIYTTGYFSGTVNFDSFSLTSAGQEDIFISKLNADGTVAWAKEMGGGGFDEGDSIAIDNSGNVYTSGYFQGTADFDPGTGTFPLTSMGGDDAFISKLDADGNFVWAKSFGGSLGDYAEGLTVDSSGNVYISGIFSDTVDFDPGAGTFELTSAGDTDIFISKLNADGSFAWAKNLGGSSGDWSNGITIDSSGNIYTTGSFQDTVDFDPGLGANLNSSAGSYDIFIHKLEPGVAPTVVSITSSTPDGSYAAGSLIPITIAFSEAVNVTGSPTLALNSGGSATYTSGSGTNTLTFNYTVGAGENVSDLDYSSISALTGGTIQDAATNNANLTLSSPGTANSLGANKNIVVDAIAPTLTNSNKTENEDNNITFTATDFTAGFTDTGGNSLSKIKIIALPANGILSLNGTAVTVNQEINAADLGHLTFTPNPDFNGSDSFTWNGSDGTNYATTDSTVNLTVNPIQDIPTLLGNVNKSANEDSAITFTPTDFTVAFTDVDGESLLKIKITALPNHGMLALSGSAVTVNQEVNAADLGHLTFTPNADFNGSDSFTWNGFDGTAYAATNSTVNLTINSVQDIPTLLGTVNKSGNEDSAITFTPTDFTVAFTDVDGESLLKIKITALPNHGILMLSGSAVTVNQEIATTQLNNLTFTPDANFNGSTSFTWQGSDGTAYAANDSTVNLTVNPVENTPTTPTTPTTPPETGSGNLLVTPINLNILEGGRLGRFEISLTVQPTADVTISFNHSSQLQSIADLTFTIENWNQPQGVVLISTDDALQEGNQTETIGFNITSPDTNYQNLTVDPISVNINDNDTPGLSIIQPVLNTHALEGGGSDNYKFRLHTQPTADVVVDIFTDGQINSNKQTLLFTPDNWNVSQTVLVNAVDDSQKENLLQSQITYQMTSADPNYNQFSIDPLVVQVSDHESGQENFVDMSEASPIPSSSKVSISGTDGDDVLQGSTHDDIVYSRRGNDVVFGGNGDDILYGQWGNDWISGGNGKDIIIGSIDDDYLTGDNGKDKIFGSDGTDRIYGGNGNDSLYGEYGNDHLFGGAGADVLVGNPGLDAFAVGHGTGGMTLEEADTITDFTLGEDVIDLIDGVGFADLTIVQGSGVYANDTVIQVTATQEYLAVLSNVEAASLIAGNFI
jgi:Ca2+-binding RTX toxin-like protein